ncbi:MAG: hypothetical protein ACYSTF_05545 [Planctomycetota bacterium]
MAEYKTNEHCIIGNPSCNHVFNSTRMCFVARPADGDFQLEEDVLRAILTAHNYETYVAMRESDPGRFAFCTKICSKIITSHFCIAILNPSKHASYSDVMIPNPNVHLEYGMMMGFHKHVIPMQRSTAILPFNIYPIDTIKYDPQTFKSKAEDAIDEIIMRLTTKEPPGFQAPHKIVKYYAFKGMRYSDVRGDINSGLYNLGATLGFHLFNGVDGFVFFGYFLEVEPREILVSVKFLLKNIDDAYKRVAKAQGTDRLAEQAREILAHISLEVLVKDDAPIEKMNKKIAEFLQNSQNVPVKLLYLSDIDKAVEQEYESLKF